MYPFFDERSKEERFPGDRYLFKGPGIYFPRVEEKILSSDQAVVIGPNTALLLQASRDLVDARGNERIAGKKWLERQQGAYTPGPYEVMIKIMQAKVLTETTALHLRAIKNYTDIYGKDRKAGEEWLVTLDMAEAHIVSHEEMDNGIVRSTVLNSRQYCVVMNPVDKAG